MNTVITQNTTWSGEVNLAANIQIAEGVTLTIEEGATITGGSLEVYGSLIVDGSAGNLVTLNDVEITTNLLNTSDVVDIHYANINGGSFSSWEGGNYQLTDSVVDSWDSYQKIWFPSSDVLIARNVFKDIGQFYIGTNNDGTVTFENNLFYDTDNASSPVIENWAAYGDPVLVTGNSFMNTNRVALGLKDDTGTAKITATENWFNTTNIDEINARVLDQNDSLSYASVIDVSGYLSAANSSTPVVINTIQGTTSDDILDGTTGIDNISTLEGADIVYALAGNDTITLTADAVWGSGYVARNVSNDSSTGTGEKITLEGLNRFADVIDGGADIDSIILTSGNDAFFIDDVYSAHHSSLTLSSTTQGVDSTARIVNLEVINAGDGNDIVDLTSSNYILANAIEINGEAGNDILWGSNGNDTIDGGTGDDSIFGGAGSDTLTGGTGADIFQFTATAGSNVITDFDFDVSGSVDSIQLYYRADDNHANLDLTLANGILTWDVDATNNDVVIDLSATVVSTQILDDLSIVFVEIV